MDGWNETVDDVVVCRRSCPGSTCTRTHSPTHRRSLVPNSLHFLHLVGVRAQLDLPSNTDTAVQVPHTQTLQAPHTLGLLAHVTVACLRLLAGCLDGADIRDNDQRANKLAPVARLGSLLRLCSQDEVHRPRDANSGQLLDPQHLEVDKP